MTSSERGITFEFAPATGQRQVIRIGGKVDALGVLRGQIGVDGQPPVPLNSFIYP